MAIAAIRIFNLHGGLVTLDLGVDDVDRSTATDPRTARVWWAQAINRHAPGIIMQVTYKGVLVFNADSLPGFMFFDATDQLNKNTRVELRHLTITVNGELWTG